MPTSEGNGVLAQDRGDRVGLDPELISINVTRAHGGGTQDETRGPDMPPIAPRCGVIGEGDTRLVMQLAFRPSKIES